MSRCTLVPAVLAALLFLPGCGGSAAGAGADAAARSTRPAAKETCPDVRWTPPPSLGIEQTHRELVPFTPSLLGVHAMWAGNGVTVETSAGGYVDDLTEPYDDLGSAGSMTLAHGAEAEVLRGHAQEAPLLVLLWREPSVEPPCDVHAVLITGANPAVEKDLLARLG
jgi:hypothetical protein